MTDLNQINTFLAGPTPEAWLAAAVANQPLLLIDHANCEKKAASTAMHLIYRYIDKPDLLYRISRLAREELRHFEQVVAIMQARNIQYVPLSASRYAAALRALCRQQEPARLVDTLLCGAFIEARSCERFARLWPLLDAQLGRFYESLLRSESRHFQDYLKLAERYSDEPLKPHIERFRAREQQLIESVDSELRFHSGVPKSVQI